MQIDFSDRKVGEKTVRKKIKIPGRLMLFLEEELRLQSFAPGLFYIWRDYNLS